MTDIIFLERARLALQRHHDWHLGQDRDAAAWGIDPVDAYSESGLCEATVEALGLLDAEINRRMGDRP